MIFLGFLAACLALVNAQGRPIDRRGSEWNPGHQSNNPTSPKSNTVIENRNVNIIVNVDPKDVAKELWKLIQSRLEMREGRRADYSRETIHDLEKIVAPIVAPSRRRSRPSAFEIAYALDHLTRKVILSNHLVGPTIDDEIIIRDIVATMLVKLKDMMLLKEKTPLKAPKGRFDPYRRMMSNDEETFINVDELEDNDDEDDEFIYINVKIPKSELAKSRFVTSDDDEA